MVMNNKLVVPVALGLSLVTVSAFVIYYIFKNEEDVPENKTQIKTSKHNVIEINVSKSIVPALIGRSGSNIKEIENKSGAKILFKKFSDKDYDVCIIRGRMETAQLAETMIHDFIRSQPLIEEDTMLVPSWACGRIIGTGGENISDISHTSGARVKLDRILDDSTVRQITFRGSKEQIKKARGLIENCVSQEKCRREIEQSKRSPRHGQALPLVTTLSETPSEMPGEANTAHSYKHVTSKKSEVSGAPIEVYVSAVSSPSRFWVQFVGPQVARLDDLVQQMTDYYNNKDNRTAHALKQVSVGQVVAAVFRHDGRWYRARVSDLRPNEFDPTQQVADVFYLDYGDSEYVATHELCDLRADLLRLRFQAMECFLAGVRPRGPEREVVGVTPAGQRWDRWRPEAIERFEELTQVARWKALVSKTCTYKKSVTEDNEKEKEIPGIKLYDVNEQGEVDIGAVLVAEGWADPAPPTTFGDLGNSRVLGMLSDRGDRSASLPRDNVATSPSHTIVNAQAKPMSTSLASGLEKSEKPTTSVNPVIMSYPETSPQIKTHINGSHESFLNAERQTDKSSIETLVATPNLGKSQRDEFKANMNRIDSHHNNLETLGRAQNEHNNM